VTIGSDGSFFLLRRQAPFKFGRSGCAAPLGFLDRGFRLLPLLSQSAGLMFANRRSARLPRQSEDDSTPACHINVLLARPGCSARRSASPAGAQHVTEGQWLRFNMRVLLVVAP
jgi:hypothetical protein